jgi:hypothetical protein
MVVLSQQWVPRTAGAAMMGHECCHQLLCCASFSLTVNECCVVVLQATDAADKQRALRALARATTASLISKTLDYALTGQVRSQDFAGVLVSLARQGGLGFNMTWQFVLDRTEDIMAKYAGGWWARWSNVPRCM